MEFPVFDLHSDTSNPIVGQGGIPCCELRENNAHVDLMRAKTLKGYAQCFACFCWQGMFKNGENPFEKKLAAMKIQFEKNKDILRQAFSAEDVENNYKNGLMSAILTIEGPAGFNFDPAKLENLYKNEGFRISTLGWNEINPLAGYHGSNVGLTDLGKEYVKEAQRLGMLIDVSHLSDEGFWDIMKITEKPIIASHSNSRKVQNISRNISDEMFLAIKETGGVCGINFYDVCLGENPTIDTYCDHILHFVELDPEAKHISLGGDLDGIEILPENFNGVEDYPKIAVRLSERGLSDDLILNIFWKNALRALKNA